MQHYCCVERPGSRVTAPPGPAANTLCLDRGCKSPTHTQHTAGAIQPGTLKRAQIHTHTAIWQLNRCIWWWTQPGSETNQHLPSVLQLSVCFPFYTQTPSSSAPSWYSESWIENNQLWELEPLIKNVFCWNQTINVCKLTLITLRRNAWKCMKSHSGGSLIKE